MHSESEFAFLKGLLLDLAQERSVDHLLQMIVHRLAEHPHVALARLWLIQPGDICASCPMRAECPDQTACLHLVASAGHPVADSTSDWSRLNGDFCRFPLGVRKTGHIGATGEPVEVSDIRRDDTWIAHPEWAQREGIVGFGGQPLISQGNILGVLVLFTRIPLVEEWLTWLRMLADHAAAAITNARAFEEIARLKRQLELENTYLREEVSEAYAFGDIVGQSSALRNVLQQIALVAPTDASVLILGESGTGKELVAHEIHKRSLRQDQPFIKVNCASIPAELFESEFFGHVKGAFTGAVKDRIGRFAAAQGGTLFLDEVGEIPLMLQSKLLRVLQEGQYERVGEEITRQVDVRIIAATNQELTQAVQAGRFRQDLYYRLNVFPIEVPPLRHRQEDIPLLAVHFLEWMARKMRKSPPRLTQANFLALQHYAWPGNVRELRNVLERAMIVSRGGRLHLDLPSGKVQGMSWPQAVEREPESTVDIVPDREMKRRERENLLRALRRTGWKIYGPKGTAALLGVKPTTLASRIKKLRLKKPGETSGE